MELLERVKHCSIISFLAGVFASCAAIVMGWDIVPIECEDAPSFVPVWRAVSSEMNGMPHYTSSHFKCIFAHINAFIIRRMKSYWGMRHEFKQHSNRTTTKNDVCEERVRMSSCEVSYYYFFISFCTFLKRRRFSEVSREKLITDELGSVEERFVFGMQCLWVDKMCIHRNQKHISVEWFDCNRIPCAARSLLCQTWFCRDNFASRGNIAGNIVTCCGGKWAHA